MYSEATDLYKISYMSYNYFVILIYSWFRWRHIFNMIFEMINYDTEKMRLLYCGMM